MNFDHYSGTPLLPEVVAAMRPWFTENFSSAAPFHSGGIAAREALVMAREQLTKFLGARNPDEIIFTAGGTEAANLAVKGTALAHQSRGRHIVVSALEHPSVLNSVEWLEAQGFTATRVSVDGEGRVNPAAIGEALREDTILVCVQHANPDLGTLQPVREIAALLNERGIPLFVDASVSAGSVPVNARDLGATLVSLAPHRFNGPRGVGVLWRRARTALAPLIHGGDQESGLRAGTENLAAIVGAGIASEITARELPERQSRHEILQKRFLTLVREQIEFVRLNGPEPGSKRLPSHLSLSLEFTEGEGLALVLDLAGVAIGAGPACVSKGRKISPALDAIGVPPELARGTVTITLGRENTLDDVEPAIAALSKAVAKVRSLSPAWEDFQAGRVASVLASK